MMNMINLDKLNDQQKAAVNTIEGPCLVIAGAGSGKTRVLTTRILNMLENNIPPYQIMAITFTNKAAREMEERILSQTNERGMYIGTFHSFGLKLIRKYYAEIGYDKNITILDSDDTNTVIKKILKESNIDPKVLSPSYVRNKISFIKNELLNEAEISNYFNTPYEKMVIHVYEKYHDMLKKNNSVDFDDLLLLPVKILQSNKLILEEVQNQYRYLLIDEYQDTNEVQYKLAKILASKYQNIFVVGDQDQSIYSFRGANYQNILNFEKDYPQAKVIKLEENYRSTQKILDIANSVIKNNKKRKEKVLWSSISNNIPVKYLRSYDEKHEVTLVLEQIYELISKGISKDEIAVLYRTNAQSRIVEEVFLKSNMPYRVVGSYYFYSRKEIKDLICYLRLILNPNDDISLRRIINVPKRKIGDTAVIKLEEKARQEKIPMYAALSTPAELSFKKIMDKLIKESANLSLTELIECVLEETGLKEMYTNDPSLEAEIKWENLNEFKSITANFEDRTGSVNLNDFLEEISLIADMANYQNSGSEVTLMTVHSAKGLEFEAVFMIGMEEALFPHSNSLLDYEQMEEERRLCYVAITRAKKYLFLLNAKRRMLYGRETMNLPSRFIDEIGLDNLEVANQLGEEKSKIKSEEMYTNNDADYKIGDKIIHDTYGPGVVVSVDKMFISIAFKKAYGIKKLIKTHRSIKKG